MRETSTRDIYNIWANFYDLLWLSIVHRRTRRAIRQMNIKPGERILDVGVGTGLALPAYPSRASVVGVDLSEGMLERARDRIDRERIDHVQLVLGNGLTLPFSDNTFDHVLLSHVVSVVSDPVRLLAEVQRVARPGGAMVLINHFQSQHPFFGRLERWLCPLCEHLGWRSDLALNDLLKATGLEVDFRYKLDQLDLFQIVFIRLPETPPAVTVAA